MDGERIVFFLSYSYICKFYGHPKLEIRLSSFDNSHILLPITSLKKLKGTSKVSIQYMTLHLVIRLVFPYLKKKITKVLSICMASPSVITHLAVVSHTARHEPNRAIIKNTDLI